ncbi:hypothetical protein EOM09_00195 [bacterium]|nr:hypothetical protein [bacterium]
MYYILFTTSTCFRCPDFKKNILKIVDFDGEILDEKNNNFLSMAQQFSIMSVPNIIIFKDKTKKEEIFRTSEEYDLISWLRKK